MKRLRKPLSRLLVLLALGLAILPLLGCTPEDALGLLTTVVENLPEGTDAPEPTAPPEETATPAQTPEPASFTPGIAYGADYTDPYDIADYLHDYGELPPNFLTKDEARELGWDSAAGNLWDVAPGMSIGGDRFGNREKLLPEADGRAWYECDANYAGGYRGAERVLYSSDGLIYYTPDHYETFTAIYE